MDNPKLRFKEMPIDLEVRDRFISQTGNGAGPKENEVLELARERFACSLGPSLLGFVP